MKIRFDYYLVKNKRLKELPIVLYIRSGRETSTIGLKKNIDEMYWDKSKQRVIDKYSFAFSMNIELNEFENKVKKIVNSLLTDNEDITFSQLIVELKKRLSDNKDDAPKKINFWQILDEFIEYTEHNSSKANANSYKRIIKYLKLFRKNIAMEDINYNLLDDFKTFLLKKKLHRNHILKVIKITKTFFSYCYRRKYIKDNSFREVKNVTEVETEHLALTTQELLAIETIDLPASLDVARDFLLLMVYTGQAYADMVLFNKRDVIDNVWYRRREKSDVPFLVPLVDKALAIIEKYNGDIPKFSNKHYNTLFKKIGLLAGMTGDFKKTKPYGNENIEIIEKRYENLTCHSGRRTFITLAIYNQIPPNILIKITGHSSTRMIEKYFKNDVARTVQLTKTIKEFN